VVVLKRGQEEPRLSALLGFIVLIRAGVMNAAFLPLGAPSPTAAAPTLLGCTSGNSHEPYPRSISIRELTVMILCLLLPLFASLFFCCNF
jgi:hypothetical protein